MEAPQPLIANEDQIFEILSTSAYLIVNKQLLEKFGPEVAILLSNLIDKYKYYKENGLLEQGSYFYLLNEEQMKQTGMNLYKVKSCKKVLKDVDIIKTRRIANKEYYRLDAVKVLEFINSQMNIDEQLDENQPPARRISTTNTKENREGEKKIVKEKLYDPEKFLEMFPEDWVNNPEFETSLDNFVQHRKELNRPLTKRSMTTIRNRLVEYPLDLTTYSIDLAVEKGYIAPYPETAQRSFNIRGDVNAPLAREPDKSPEEIFQDYFKGSYAKRFNAYYETAVNLLINSENGQTHQLARNMIQLHSDVKTRQTDKAQQHKDIPNPGAIVRDYTYWLEDQSWIDEITPKLFQFQHTIFNKFLNTLGTAIGTHVISGERQFSRA